WCTSSQASEPCSIGAPEEQGDQLIPASLSCRRLAIVRPIASCSSVRTLMHRLSHSRSLAKVYEEHIGRKATSGGSIETDVKVPTIIARASPSGCTPVTMTTPVG